MTSNRTRGVRRLVGAATAATVVAGALALSPAHAAIPIDDACPAHTPEDGFTDTGVDGSPVEHAVDCLVGHGISQGRGAGLYASRELVTRGQLATFVLRVLEDVDGFTPPAHPRDAFPDVAADDVHREKINLAAELGLISGYGDGTFRSLEPVSRAQMAKFIVNTLEEAGVTVPVGGNGFTDDEGNVHEEKIDSLKALGIVEGDENGLYQPGRAVRRDTMALFLTRTLEVLVEEGLFEPFPAPGPTIVDARALDGGVVGVVDAGDVHQIIFSEPMAVTADDDGELYRVADDDGTIAEVVCGVSATCVLQGAGTFGGTTYPTNQVLRIFVTGPVTALDGAEGTIPGLQYPVTITHASAGFVDTIGRDLVLDRRSDKIISAGPITPTIVEGDTTGPDMVAADGDSSEEAILITYSEGVVCEPEAATQFVYSDSAVTGLHPTAAVCDGTDEVWLYFANGGLTALDHGVLTYADGEAGADADDVRDNVGNQAARTESVTVMML